MLFYSNIIPFYASITTKLAAIPAASEIPHPFSFYMQSIQIRPIGANYLLIPIKAILPYPPALFHIRISPVHINQPISLLYPVGCGQ